MMYTEIGAGKVKAGLLCDLRHKCHARRVVFGIAVGVKPEQAVAAVMSRRCF